MYFEGEINQFEFRYDSESGYIEVSKKNEKPRNVIYEIHVGELSTKKDFDKEISFWFMENGNNI